jgi:hypothetical protein
MVRRVPENENKVICGRKPATGEKRPMTMINTWHLDRGVIASPTGDEAT